MPFDSIHGIVRSKLLNLHIGQYHSPFTVLDSLGNEDGMLTKTQLSGRRRTRPGGLINRISGKSMGIDIANNDQITILFRQ